MKTSISKLQWSVLGILFVSTFFIWSIAFSLERDDSLLVAFLDVGQGDAIFIQAPNGTQLLIDGGPNKTILRELSEILPYHDRSIDVVMATHPDKDHIGGLVSVLERYEVDMVIEPGVRADTNVYRSFQNDIESFGIEKVIAKRGMLLVLDKKNGVYVHILFPNQDVEEWDSNDASIVAKLIYGDTSFLLTGDSPKGIEKYITFLDGSYLDSDVLKLGHHGSKTSSSIEFLRAASPEYSIISAGKDNRYGHPHSEVMENIKMINSIPLATYDEGTIRITSDGKEVSLQSTTSQ
ncbi:hypothetical protein COB64_01295 [Candidatus Wolfebacteria bacterium]|nr:MAG: hypothetical protein COB64_01295 [Candidatus Wolfebacteria bacterium]